MKLLISLGLILSPPARAAAEEACPQRLIFLPQTHAVENIPGREVALGDRREVAVSQLKILNYLDRFPQRAVFSEQVVAEDFDYADIDQDSKIKLNAMVSRIFPHGFNIDPKTLTDEQTAKLIDNGAEFIQMMRGRLPNIHRVVADKAAESRIFTPIKKWTATHPSGTPYPPEISRKVYGEREEELLKQVKKYFAANPGQRDAIVMFGSNHNFSFYPEIFPPRCVVIPPEFRAEWGGQYRSGPDGFPADLMRTGVLPTAPGAAK